MFNGKKVSLVLPAYNEEKGIGKAVDDFKRLKLFDEILIIDNNSNDKTSEIAKSKGASVYKEKKQGYGFAIRAGLKKASGDIIVLSEPDGTFTAKDSIRLLKHLDGYGMVTGTRTNKKYIQKKANMGFLLRTGNVIIAKLLQILFRTSSISDCGCTFRVFTKRLARIIAKDSTVGQSHFLPETVIIATLNNFKLLEIPVWYGKRIGESKITGSLVTSIKVGINMLLLIIYYRIKNPSGYKSNYPYT